MILAKNHSVSGTSLVEASIAACTAALFLGSLFTMNMTAMKTIRTAREATSASQVLQQRVESMRIANWHQITNADWVAANLLNSNAAGTENLKQTTETLTLIPYGSNATGTTQIVRSGNSAQIVHRNSSLLTEGAIKVVWTLAYSGGINAQSTTRQTVAILAKGGVAKW
ncbi:MAG TPA: hypothetical protein VG095_02730 [Chthoniobacterales bacterium]|nr:hypothetical protein [Chthoniobacterales bacterium]